MDRSAQGQACTGFPLPLRYPDVDPDTLEREAAAERTDPAAGAWPSYLRRTLPTGTGHIRLAKPGA